MSVQSEFEDTRNIWLSDFRSGMRGCLPLIVAVLPFGFLFGALAVANGFSVFEATLMSGAIYGGASQMVGIELFGQKIAPWVVVLSIFAVNFRHVLYSAALGRKIKSWTLAQQAVAFFLLTDPQYAQSERRDELGLLTFAWYLGFGLPVWLAWVAEAWIGAHFARLVPDPNSLGLGFLLPIYFLGLVMGFRKRPFWLPVVLASAVASILAYQFVGSPWHVSIGAAAGVFLAAFAAPVKSVGETQL
ncbi:branched-chain amino acid ABC transporter permease [Mesorhizobium sp. NBSH29]|uniref:AzlC family ABC transporter permease n=1 Tax=Mesorhizobium sp. NBSH29 TaxID=2654249 RepID=UPI0018966A3D|nr:AzlC family ABC transporter permease [Mesorhizobium sp. NBSH29]QPC88191.1 branched-chain amino acid ABC transporter permease [Mesorhizobium sp. NBSH29]